MSGSDLADQLPNADPVTELARQVRELAQTQSLIVTQLSEIVSLIATERTDPPTESRRAQSPQIVDSAPMTNAQRGILLAQLRYPQSNVWNIQNKMTLTGAVDEAALETALRQVIERHHSLRARYVTGADGQYEQQILAPPPVRLQVSDLTGCPADERDERVRQICQQVGAAPFQLDQGVFPRYQLIRVTPEQWVLILVMHHSYIDGWAFDVLLQDLAEFYRAARAREPHRLTEPASQCTDFARWQETQHTPEAAARQLRRSLAYLEGTRVATDLPSDRPRPRLASGQGNTVRLIVPLAIMEAAQRTAIAVRSTLFAVSTAAMVVLLNSLTGSGDIAVCFPYANRESAAFTETVTCTSVTLALVVRLAGAQTFAEVVSRTSHAALEAIEIGVMPRQVTGALRDAGFANVPATLPVIFAFQGLSAITAALPDLALQVEELAVDAARAELTFTLERCPNPADGFRASLEYSTDRWNQSTAEALLRGYVDLLVELCAAPEGRPEDAAAYRRLASWRHGIPPAARPT